MPYGLSVKDVSGGVVLKVGDGTTEGWTKAPVFLMTEGSISTSVLTSGEVLCAGIYDMLDLTYEQAYEVKYDSCLPVIKPSSVVDCAFGYIIPSKTNYPDTTSPMLHGVVGYTAGGAGSFSFRIYTPNLDYNVPDYGLKLNIWNPGGQEIVRTLVFGQETTIADLVTVTPVSPTIAEDGTSTHKDVTVSNADINYFGLCGVVTDRPSPAYWDYGGGVIHPVVTRTNASSYYQDVLEFKQWQLMLKRINSTTVRVTPVCVLTTYNLKTDALHEWYLDYNLAPDYYTYDLVLLEVSS